MRSAILPTVVLLSLLVGACGPESPPGDDPSTTTSALRKRNLLGEVSTIDVPGAGFYPNGLAASSDGALYVGSLFGEVLKYQPNSLNPSVLIPQVGKPGTIIANMLVSGTTLLVCGDLFTGPTVFSVPVATLYAYDLDGTPQASYPLPNQGQSLCEDIAITRDGTLYVTDALTGAIYRMQGPRTASSVLVPWTQSAVLLPNFSGTAPPFGAHGITADGEELYVSNFSASALYRIPINEDGSAGAPVLQTVEPSYTNPESLRTIGRNRLLANEDVWCGAGNLVELKRSEEDPDVWTKTVLRTDLNGATNIAIANDSYYNAESQVCTIVTQFLGGPPANPQLPFVIDRTAN